MNYESPKVTELGSVQDLTLSTIHKSSWQRATSSSSTELSIPVPGGGVTSVS